MIRSTVTCPDFHISVHGVLAMECGVKILKE